ncbi:MAG: hypothetical protein R3D55_20540 [Chloroflexota bacterium]
MNESVWIMLLVGAFVLFCILGLTFEGFATVSHDRLGRFPNSGGKKFYQRFVQPYWPLWLIPVLLTTVGPAIARSYYGFYSADVSRSLLFLISFLAFFTFGFSALLPPEYSTLRLAQKLSTTIIVFVAMILMIIVFGFLTIPRASQQLEGIVSGPSFGEGILEGKDRDPIRGGVIYKLEIDGHHYQTPDSQFFKNSVVGEPIHFAYNSSADYWRPEVFNPTKIRLSTWDTITLIAAIVNWVILSFLVVDGWISLIRRNIERFM